jgi:hypothetical protein
MFRQSWRNLITSDMLVAWKSRGVWLREWGRWCVLLKQRGRDGDRIDLWDWGAFDVVLQARNGSKSIAKRMMGERICVQKEQSEGKSRRKNGMEVI